MDVLDRINPQLTALVTLTEGAAKVAEEGKTAREAKRAADSFYRAVSSIFDEEGALGTLSPESVQYLSLAKRAAFNASESLGAASGEDRTEGDKLARGLSMAIEFSWLDDNPEVRDAVEAAVTAWNATAPKGGGTKGTRSTTGSTEAKRDLPFPVKVTCEAHGWTATQGTNKNSLRWAAILHHEKDHGHKPARGEAIHQGLTEAIDAVVNGAAHAQGGGYLVDKATA